MSSLRTDNDTWDIASSVGATAVMVAAARAAETERPEPLIDDPYAKILVAGAGNGAWQYIADDGFVAKVTESDPEIGPLFEHMKNYQAVRTHFFDAFFAAAVDAGIRQIVILASGLDSRAYRLDWPAGTTVFEIDQPKVLEFKEQVLTEHDARPKTDRRTVAVDLREDWPAALRRAGFDPGKPTAWSAEGLLPYLPGAAQDALFEQVNQLSAPGSHLGVESFVAGTDVKRFATLKTKYFDKSLFGGIDPTELFYDDKRADPAPWLAETGWAVQAFSPAELARTYGRPTPDLPDELAELWEQPRYLIAVR